MSPDDITTANDASAAGPDRSAAAEAGSRRYVMAVQAAAYPLADGRFATESAFAEHLRELLGAAGSTFDTITLVAPRMPEEEFRRQEPYLAVLEPSRDRIVLTPMPNDPLSPRRAIGQLRALWRAGRRAVSGARLVHVDLATDVRRPMTALVGLAAWRTGTPVVSVVDIDFRQHADRFRRLGHWGVARYLYNRFVQQPAKAAQIAFAVRRYQLVMLKSPSLVRDFGRGRPHVRSFYDTVHASSQILSDAGLEARRIAIIDPARPLRLCYFGRLVEYKGVDRMIEAVAIARRRGVAVELAIIGDGPVRAALAEQASRLDIAAHVDFAGQVPYGTPLFDRLADQHAVLATPLIEDTPRAAFDAMARGLPIIAFDISYFRDLAEESGAVALATWPDASALADRIADLAADRDKLADMATAGVAFAHANTQQIWLDRRIAWTRRYALGLGE